MENAILTWVAVREYIPNTLSANIQQQNFIWRAGKVDLSRKFDLIEIQGLIPLTMSDHEG
jgi:hypothetical protein